MDTVELVQKLEGFFDLSKKKRKKKRQKIIKIIGKLEENKRRLDLEVREESKRDETSSRYQELLQEQQVLSRLIKKARKLKLSNDLDPDD